jgi:hypothetical protein
MSNTSSSAGGGIGFFGLLGIVFIVLKLCKVIDWDWLWVLAPLWGPLCLVVFCLLVWLIVMVISTVTGRRSRIVRRQRGWWDPMDDRRFR